MSVGQRISDWLLRDLTLRSGFREVIDQIPLGGRDMITAYWAQRIDEELADNRFIKALEQIRDMDYRGNRHESASIAFRVLGPRRAEQAAAAGVATLAADDGLHVVQQDLFAPTHQVVKAAPPVAGPTPATGPVEEIADI